MDVIYFSSKYAVIAPAGYMSAGSAVWTSSDGITWDDTIILDGLPTAMCTFGANLYVTGSFGLMQIDANFVGTITSAIGGHSLIVFGANLYIIDGLKIYRTSDGSTLSLVEEFSSADCLSLTAFVTHSTNLFVGTDNGKIYSSSDGLTYSLASTIVAGKAIQSMVSYGGYLYAIPYGSGIYRSTDGTTWSLLSSISAVKLLLNCNGQLIAMGNTASGSYMRIASYIMGEQDQILMASNARHGLMGMTQAKTLKDIATAASQDRWRTTGSYTGNGAASNYVSIGFQPGYVRIKDYVTNGSLWEGIQGATFCFRHLGATAAALKHAHQVASITIKMTTYGFKTYSVAGLNVSSRQYKYIAIKES